MKKILLGLFLLSGLVSAQTTPDIEQVRTATTDSVTTPGYVLTTGTDGLPVWAVPPTAGTQVYWFYKSAADVGGYYYMKNTASTGGIQSYANLAVTNGQLLVTHITEVGFPALTFIPSGTISMHTYAAKTSGTKALSLYAEIYKRSYPGGVETLLCTTGNSIPLVTGAGTSALVYTGTLTSSVTLLISDRIVKKIYASVSGGGSAPDVTIYGEDATQSHIELPAATVSVNNFWGTQGNPVSDSTINFLGTTNNTPLILKTNSVERVRVGITGSVNVVTGLVAPLISATTSLTSPLLIGGSAVGSKITYKSTTGAGTTSAIGHEFTGGTNGATSIARLYNNGSIDIGTAAADIAATNLSISKTITGGTNAYGVYLNSTIQSGVTSVARMFLSAPSTVASVFNVGTFIHFQVNSAALGAGSTITGQRGYFCNDLTTATNNYGFWGALSSGANKWNNYMVGTAQNYFEGNVGIGLPVALAKLHTQSTTEQLRVGYDASNYYSTTVGSTGGVTLNSVGAGSAFTFSDAVTFPTPFTLGATSVTTTGTQLNYLNAATGTTGTASTNLVFSTSPTLVTPTLGVATATSINGNTFTTGTYTLTGTAAKTLNFTNSLTLTGTDATVMTFPTTTATIARTDASQTFAGTQTITNDAVINGLTVGKGAGNVFSNTSVGSSSLSLITTTGRHSAFGYQTLRYNTSGQGNTANGYYSSRLMTSGSSNTSIGEHSNYTDTSGSFNTAIGAYSLYSNYNGSRSVSLGYNAGYYETASDAFYLHNGLGVSSLATGKTNSLMYGTFNATAASQTLAINAATSTHSVNINGGTLATNAKLGVHNGHIQSSQTTKPTIVVTTQNGVTAATIDNGSTDTKGKITTTGTNNGGYTHLTITFNTAYAVAPIVHVQSTNDPSTVIQHYQSTTTTTFNFIWLATGAPNADLTFSYWVIE